MFKINDKVKLKEVHKNYCRGEKTIIELEELMHSQTIGTVVSIDEVDKELNVYVNFENKKGIWLNKDELMESVSMLEDTKDLATFWSEIIKEFEEKKIDFEEKEEHKDVVMNTIEEKESKKELDDFVKARLFERLVEIQRLDVDEVYEDYLIEQLSKDYLEIALDELEFNYKEEKQKEVLELIKFIINEIVFDFDIDTEKIKEILEKL